MDMNLNLIHEEKANVPTKSVGILTSHYSEGFQSKHFSPRQDINVPHARPLPAKRTSTYNFRAKVNHAWSFLFIH